MANNDERGNGFNLRGDLSLGELLTVLSIAGAALAFYFGGQGNIADRIGKLETRVALTEQHQVQTDNVLLEVRADLAKISDKIDDLRPLLVNRGSADGGHR